MYRYRLLCGILLLMTSHILAEAENFGDFFVDKTLRMDYTFSGDSAKQYIFLDEMNVSPRWYGKRHHLKEVPLEGNGQIIMRDTETDSIIYRNSFSTLFQEWLSTQEASTQKKSFENVFLLPFPRHTAKVTVELYDTHRHIAACATHDVDPNDILIRHIGEHKTPYITLQEAVDTNQCIHIAYVAEGYTKKEMPTFLTDCHRAMEALFRHEPFKSMRSRFNMIAVEAESHDSGISIPRQGIWKNTALSSHFDTFYSDRYNTTLRLKKLNDVLAGTPYEHIIIICNTNIYGGGGIYNSYTAANAHANKFEPVVVHEFGHSFGGLGDEYSSNESWDGMYPSDTEPWEPNITTLHDFHGKWENLIKEGTPCPTPESKDINTIITKVGYFEGAGSQMKGVYRGVQDCRMKTNEVPEFCPVCKQALTRLIKFYTGE